jgi:ATP-dependent DNA ligase
VLEHRRTVDVDVLADLQATRRTAEKPSPARPSHHARSVFLFAFDLLQINGKDMRF